MCFFLFPRFYHGDPIHIARNNNVLRNTVWGKMHSIYSIYILGSMPPSNTALFLPFQALCNAKVNCLCVSTQYLAVNGTKPQ